MSFWDVCFMSIIISFDFETKSCYISNQIASDSPKVSNWLRSLRKSQIVYWCSVPCINKLKMHGGMSGKSLILPVPITQFIHIRFFCMSQTRLVFRQSQQTHYLYWPNFCGPLSALAASCFKLFHSSSNVPYEKISTFLPLKLLNNAV